MNNRRLLAVAGDVLRSQIRSVPLLMLLGFIVFASISINPAAMLPGGDAAVGGVEPYSNSIYALAQIFALAGVIFYTLMVPLIAGTTLLRDDDAGISEIIHSTPLTAAEYIFGKYLGVAVMIIVAVIWHVAVTMFWQEFGATFGADVVHGPHALANYLLPAAIFTLFGALVCAALALLVAEYARSAIALYTLVTVLFAWSSVALMPAGADDGRFLSPAFAWVDFWGAHWLTTEVITAERSIPDFNHGTLVFDARFVASRVVLALLATSALVMAIRHRARRMRGAVTFGSFPTAQPAPPPDVPLAGSAMPLSTLRMRASKPSLWPCVATSARVELRILSRQVAPYVFMLLAALLVLEVGQGQRGPFDSASRLTSGALATASIPILTVVGCVLLLVCLVEALDRARQRRLHELLHSSVAHSAALLLGPAMASAGALVAMLAVSMLAALAMIAAQGKAPLTVAPFLWTWGVVLAPGFLLFAAFVIAVYTRTRQRALAYAAGMLALLGTIAAHLGSGLGWLTNWPLWSALVHSDYRAVTDVDASVAWNRALMLALALTLANFAYWSHKRRDTDTMTQWRWPGRSRWGAALLLVALVTWPAWQLVARVARGPDGSSTISRSHAYWQRNAETWGHALPPRVRHMALDLVLEPAMGEMYVVGEYLIDAAAAQQVWPMTVGTGFGTITWTLDGQPVTSHDRAGLHLIQLPSIRAATHRLGFRYRVRLPADDHRDGRIGANFIRAESVLLDTLGTDFLPTPGFVSGRGVTHANRSDARTLTEAEARATPAIGYRYAFTSHVRIDVPQGYIANSVGTRTGARHAAGRSSYTFENREPVRALNVVAAQWSVRKVEGAAVYFHPQHAAHVTEILATLVAARRWFSEWYAPDPWPELRVSEFAALITRAQGFPSNLTLSEDMGFTTATAPDERLPTIIVAHEAAHQWWGNLLTPAAAPGADVLIESMANHATLRLLEAEHGDEARRRFALQLEQRFHERRLDGPEHALATITAVTSSADETAVYDKGALVLWMLERHLGRDAWQRGVRGFFKQHRGADRLATLSVFTAALRNEATDTAAFDDFIKQWLFGTGLPEFQIRDARVSRHGLGWRLDAVIANIGGADARVTLAARGPATAMAKTQEVLLPAESQRRIRFDVPFRPVQVVVDPNAHLLMLNRGNARWSVSNTSERVPALAAQGS